MGFDCNTVVSAADALRFYAAGYRFAVRYVPRRLSASYDITAEEAKTIRNAGLALMLVQHVARPGWVASAQIGQYYGMIAAQSAQVAGYPTGCVLWCDLEEVNRACQPMDVIGYCNAWFDQVKARGYEPGLYVGYACGLSAAELYVKLRFRRYWSAYNLDRDNYPAVRGVQMRQKPYPPPHARVPGVSFEYDENVILLDSFGSSPILWLSSSSKTE